MIRIIDYFIDRTTMYRLVLYYVGALLAIAALLSPFKVVPFDATAIVFTTVLACVVCWLANFIFAKVFGTPVNVESSLITAMIIALIMNPVTATDAAGVGGIICACIWAISGKFMLAIGKKHLFNPAALGVALSGLLIGQPATWWVAGNLALLPFVLIGGLLIARKLQRFDLIGAFIAVNIVTVAAMTPLGNIAQALLETLTHSPLFFLAFAMLTEPLTAPQARGPRLAYAAIVGILASPTIHVGSLYLTPEIALLVGNVFAYLVSPKGRFALTLLRIEKAANGAYDFIFSPDRKLRFRPGQYLEWTLGFAHADSRGNRRSFTIASAPGDDEVRLGVKFYPRASAFKRALSQMQPGDTIFASQLAGDFVLPKNPDAKLAFIAGGIGITPFRSMLKYLLDERERRDIVMLYGNASADDIAYRDVLSAAERQLGIRTIHAVAEGETPTNVYRGFITKEMIEAEIPDFRERTFYISGPHPMVSAVEKALHELGVPHRHIRTDFFPGLA
jgi:glycine betaine catabolism B